ncbi:hypothetical protein Prudu_005865 [Prunus dulcis]|uniref:Photosystem II cytochrome b559 N-terminal domain-containing protein n=1 Tax=Prunus dulcis TaxID=3755 RepID=A0A4Y1QYK5_PRUDU|nr:hypothetical protein Prudu_005865 [Prunus dulcis]
MIIDRTYPIFTVRWLAVHGLAVPTKSNRDKIRACFIAIVINRSALYSSSFFVAKLPEAYAFLNPIVDVMLV